MSDETEVARVRRMLGQARGPRGQRIFSAEARRAAADLARARQQRDIALAATARALDVHPITLAGWVRAPRVAPQATPFVAVVTPAPASTGVVVHGAGGLRIEGLTIAQLAELLRRVG